MRVLKDVLDNLLDGSDGGSGNFRAVRGGKEAQGLADSGDVGGRRDRWCRGRRGSWC